MISRDLLGKFSLPELEHKKRMELYGQGLNDYEIARHCGVTNLTIFNWRKKNGLSSNCKRGGGKRKLKYNHELLIQDYEKGLSYKELSMKYGIVRTHAGFIIRRSGIPRRNISETMLFKSNNWRKLTSSQKASRTKMFSLPGSIIQKLGLDPSEELEGKWIISNDNLILKIRKRSSK